MLGHGWKPARASIVERTQATPDVCSYVAEVRPDDGSPAFRAALNDPFDATHFDRPDVGQVVRVIYKESARHQHGSRDWKLANVKFDPSDESIFRPNDDQGGGGTIGPGGAPMWI